MSDLRRDAERLEAWAEGYEVTARHDREIDDTLAPVADDLESRASILRRVARLLRLVGEGQREGWIECAQRECIVPAPQTATYLSALATYGEDGE